MEFEAAVRLNPRNAPTRSLTWACFIEQAPGVVGRRIEKAESGGRELDKVDPARAHVLRANIAEQRKDYGTAEREFKQAIAVARIRLPVDHAGQFLSPPGALAWRWIGPSRIA